METEKTFYITTPIYYPSAKLHIGHAYSTTMADAMRRYKDMCGYKTYFITGSDEHGQKIQQAAEAAGQSPKAYVDAIVASIKDLWERFMISNDQFIRTTDQRHIDAVQKLFTKIYANGDIYLSAYEGYYCTSCETFYTKHQLIDGNLCPDCGKETELVKEESYFFKMSRYADKLLAHIEANPDFIQPTSRRNEMINFIKQGLEDLCISRTSFNWGIPVPVNDKHVIYVWFDALFNYVSALGWGTEDDSLYQTFWPANVHMVGKDIARFHAIIWPTILMAANLPLPKQVFGHGWVLIDGGKMSKSKGNVVDPNLLLDKYGVDALRYFLLRDISTGQDGNYSESSLVTRINTDLANDYGNLVSRTIAMIDKYFDGLIPEEKDPQSIDLSLQKAATSLADKAGKKLDQLDFQGALGELLHVISLSNKYIDETTPWLLAKDESQKDRLGTVLYTLADTIRIVTTLFTPFMPGLPKRCGDQLGFDFSQEVWSEASQWGKLPSGTKVAKGEALFPRIDPSSLDLPEEEADDLGPIFKEDISYDDFTKLDLRVALVKNCKPVKNADKLLEFTLDVGGQERTVLSGIRQFYQEPADLIGKKVVLLANLAPKKIRGTMSQGMILSAASDDDNLLEMLQIQGNMPSGSSIS